MYGVVGAAIVVVVVAYVASVALGVVVGVALIALVILAGLVKRSATVYVVSSQRLYIRRGMLAKRVQQTRIDRVQNVNTEQTLLNRILRVGTVDFDTAGTDDSEFRFVGSRTRTGWSRPSTAPRGKRMRSVRRRPSAAPEIARRRRFRLVT